MPLKSGEFICGEDAVDIRKFFYEGVPPLSDGIYCGVTPPKSGSFNIWREAAEI